jgi:hypothetical protein
LSLVQHLRHLPDTHSSATTGHSRPTLSLAPLGRVQHGSTSETDRRAWAESARLRAQTGDPGLLQAGGHPGQVHGTASSRSHARRRPPPHALL